MATLKLTGKFSPILIGLLLLLTPAFSWASEPSASLYLSPSSANVVSGGTLGISLKEDSGSEPINTVATKIYYPSDKLAFINHDPTGNFSGVALDSSIAGILNISAYKFGDPGLSGAQQVTAINFKAITSSGTAGINLEANFDESVVEHYSSVTSSNSNKNILKKVSAGAYTIIQQPSGSTSTAPSSQVIAPGTVSMRQLVDCHLAFCPVPSVVTLTFALMILEGATVTLDRPFSVAVFMLRESVKGMEARVVPAVSWRITV